MHRERALPLAQHEMGHYVIATVLGFQTGDVEIELLPWPGRRGGSGIDLGYGLRTLEHMDAYLVARVQVLYAGALGEALKEQPTVSLENETAVKIIRGEGGKDDHSKARELIQVLRGLRQPDHDFQDREAIQAQLDALDSELWTKARSLVIEHAKSIIGLASNLASRVHEIRQPAKITDAEFATYEGVQRLRDIGLKARKKWLG